MAGRAAKREAAAYAAGIAARKAELTARAEAMLDDASDATPTTDQLDAILRGLAPR